ncbi:hypothetical protein [Rathayibacter sp. VKM Ac-2630]|uniref:hypothetical protein n=1 Tax=Rathayibacter sp. VKM Ac-2630 TaxID=1938617 RepID=UPI000981AEB8|nr:hypothetical protein [Rathayibacter sp. VKM Ac-2630]OOB92352.1 hypothetical protein B0T42_00265 [Rathayibacter sp. VKM Ac-2630]
MSATLTPLRRERTQVLLDERVAEPGPVEASESRVVTALTLTAWAQAVVRAAASASNLSFAHTRVAVLGSGPLARELATRTAAMGARVLVVGDDPVELVELAQLGLTVAAWSGARLDDVVLAFATGELDAAVDASVLGGGGPLLLVDAAEDVPAVTAVTDPSSGRPGIARITGAAREAFVLVAREVVDGSARRTRDQLRSAFGAALAEARAADPGADRADLRARADRALALEVLA